MKLFTLAAILVLAGCATAGGVPAVGDADEELRTAQRMIESAQEAGADSLAILSMSEARAALAEANDKRGSDKNWAALKAKEATASAAYARAVAGRLKAERSRGDAKAALDALPPGGAR
jgi:hypothetical protein